MLSKAIYTGLYGVIQFPQTNDAMGCFIHSITEDCMEAIVITPSPSAYTREDVNLRIILPLAGSSIKCAGRISEEKGLIRDVKGYSARIFITQINLIDKRRLTSFMGQKKALMSSGERKY